MKKVIEFLRNNLKEKDLSNVKYSPVVKKLYKFKGEL